MKVHDNAETVGDQFEAAYLYLWITDQPRALAAMIVYSYLVDSQCVGEVTRPWSLNKLKKSTYQQRLSRMMLWQSLFDPSNILLERIPSGVGSEQDERTKERHIVLCQRTRCYAADRYL